MTTNTITEAPQQKNKTKLKTAIFIGIGIIATAIFTKNVIFKQENDNILYIGVTPEGITTEKIKYRLGDIKKSDGTIIKRTHTDSLELDMDAQSGVAYGSWATMAIKECYAPKVRDVNINSHSVISRNIPSVQCETAFGTDIMLGGEKNVRLEFLRNKYFVIYGKVVGQYAGNAVIWVEDPNF